MVRKLFVLLFLIIHFKILAQNGSLRGFIYEESSGEPAMFSNILIKKIDLGAVTDVNGFFNLSKIPVGQYKIIVSYIGFEPIEDSIKIESDKILDKKYFLKKSSIELNTIQVSAAKQESKSNINTSVVKLTARSISKLPSIGGDPDIAQFLQILPGVVFTGDQGGELYIRGGAPIHNMVLLDGMIIYNAFHSIGLFSVFDTDIIKTADVYTGGFNAEYGGRISSVIDIKTRDGNKKNISGKFSSSTFGSKFLIEGPLKFNKSKTRNSFIVSSKLSYIDKTSEYFYNYIGDNGLPYNFIDLYAKASFMGSNGSKLNLFSFNFQDNVNYSQLIDYSWKSKGFGGNFVIIPVGSTMLIEGNLAYSNYVTNQLNNDVSPRTSSISGFNTGLDFTYFLKGENQIKYGVEVLGFGNSLSYLNPSNIKISHQDNTTEFAGYIKYKKVGSRFLFEPSLRYHSYTSLGESSFEPRLGLKFNLNENLRIKSSAGLFSQNLIAINTGREVVNLFRAFISSTTNLPSSLGNNDRNTFLQKSRHIISGFEYDFNEFWSLNFEGYLKHFNQLISLNRNKIYEDNSTNENVIDELKKDFIIETGLARGLDLLFTYNNQKDINIWFVYSIGKVTRRDAFEEYYPHYDRRHNINIVSSYLFGEKKTWSIDLRWNFGSGFPFTQTQGYYENIDFSDGISTDITQSNDEIEVLYSNFNRGRMPSYHRLDFSIKKTFKFSNYNIIESVFSISNLYDRNNIFYYNQLTDSRIDQFPILPTLSLNWQF